MARKSANPVRKLSEESIWCRDLMHAWTVQTDMIMTRRKNGDPRVVERVLFCNRCGTERIDTYHLPDFTVVRTRYRYAEGYLIPGSGAIKRSQVRAEQWRRLEHSRNLVP